MILCGDALTELRKLSENSIDSIVTDPPYGLEFMGKEWDKLAAKPRGRTSKMRLRKPTIEEQNDSPQHRMGIKQPGYLLRCFNCGGNSSGSWNRCHCENPNFHSRSDLGQSMQEWHYRWAVEAFRVLKPGGHLLSFGGSRTYHRMACAIEDAGFEIRDQIMWIYGSGFPKSESASLAIDKKACRIELEARLGRKPTKDEMKAAWKEYRKDLGRSPNWRESKRNREQFGSMEVRGDNAGRLTVPTTDAAIQWNGWGTALKPAHEPICVARKPLSEKTVAENVLKWGTGAINVDGGRIDIDSVADASQLRTMNRSIKTEKNGWGMNQNSGDTPQVISGKGRWPANLIHDGSDEVVGLFPNTASGKMPAGQRRLNSLSPGRNTYGYMDSDITKHDTPADSGSAARFFYCAKASRKEREMGLEGMEERPLLWSSGTKNPGSFQSENTHRAAKNNHPTVKPLALMRYLVRLVTPPHGLVLDPFMGSGTTGIAAKVEGLEFIGIEIDKEYCKIAKKRIYGELKELYV